MAPEPRNPRGTRQPARPRTWKAEVKARQRAENRRLVEGNGGVHPDPKCPHGTPSGYENWFCRCESICRDGLPRQPVHAGEVIPVLQLWWLRPGCMAAGVTAAAERRRKRRARDRQQDAAMLQVDEWAPDQLELPQSQRTADALHDRHVTDYPPDPTGGLPDAP